MATLTTPSRAHAWLPSTALIALVALGFGGLMLGLAGDRTGRQRLATGVAILGEQSGRADLAIDAIAALPADAWQEWSGPGFLAGRTSSVVWVRVTLQNPTSVAQAGVLADAERYADQADLYLCDETGAWQHLRSGAWISARAKALWGREVAFPVSVAAGGTQTLYLRYEDRLALWLDFNWWPEAGAFHAAVLRDIVAEGAYFGMLLALLLYNLVLWVRVRFPGTGAYLLYLGTFLVFVFIARSAPALLGLALGSPWMEVGLTFGVALSGMFLAEFARQLLELPARLPRADRVARGARLAMGLFAVAALMAPAFGLNSLLYLIVLASGVTHVVLLGVAIAAWRTNARSARHFLLAFGFLFAGLMPLLATWVPALSLETAGRLGMAGSALEMLVLAVAIADRFAGLQQEKIAAQARAVVEAESRHQIQEAYADELEHEVRERTRELAAANADKDRMMAVLGHDLRSPLTALTLAAEDAATTPRADFAAEVAQTGRRVLLLLEDVVLWARLRAGVGRPADHAAAIVVAPAAELHRVMAAQRGITLAVAVEPGLKVRTDIVPAQTLVRNLVSNAVKSARSRVTVTVAGEAGAVRVVVGDDGAGLPPAAAALLGGNGPAGSIGPVRMLDSGLGLPLCVEIAQVLGTRLVVAGSPAGGTEIAFTLPRAGG